MTWPVKGPIGALGYWDTPRPLDSTPKTHVHGAVDLVASGGTSVVAPEDGGLYGFCLTRPEGRLDVWVRQVSLPLPWSFYTYDTYGGVLVLRGKSGLVHLMTHLYMRQLLDYTPLERESWMYAEESGKQRWPMTLWHTFSRPVMIREGQQIGVVGDAGMSRGDHLHWEVHRGWEWTSYSGRPDPKRLMEGKE